MIIDRNHEKMSRPPRSASEGRGNVVTREGQLSSLSDQFDLSLTLFTLSTLYFLVSGNPPYDVQCCSSLICGCSSTFDGHD